MPLEIPTFNPTQAKKAKENGASRIELNAPNSYKEGGLTPSIADLQTYRTGKTQNSQDPNTENDREKSNEEKDIPVRVMIRPRGPPEKGRDFMYTDDEISLMEESIREFVASGLLSASRGDGFVFGVLGEVHKDGNENDKDGNEGDGKHCKVNEPKNKLLIRAAHPHPCVFHRAFDEIVSDDDDTWESALEALSRCGFDGVLTSGGVGDAVAHVGVLGRIIRKARTLGLEVIVGGGVRGGNVGVLLGIGGDGDDSGSVWIHSSCLSNGEEIDLGEVEGLLAQLG